MFSIFVFIRISRWQYPHPLSNVCDYRKRTQILPAAFISRPSISDNWFLSSPLWKQIKAAALFPLTAPLAQLTNKPLLPVCL